jgi:hypothetical protein
VKKESASALSGGQTRGFYQVTGSTGFFAAGGLQWRVRGNEKRGTSAADGVSAPNRES